LEGNPKAGHFNPNELNTNQMQWKFTGRKMFKKSCKIY